MASTTALALLDRSGTRLDSFRLCRIFCTYIGLTFSAACGVPPQDTFVSEEDAPTRARDSLGSRTARPDTSQHKSSASNFVSDSTNPPAGFSWGVTITTAPPRRGFVLRLTLKNVTDRDTLLAVGGSPGQEFTFVVRDSTRAEVWSRDYGREIDMIGRFIRVPARDSVVFEHVWDGANNRGRRVDAGTYSVRGFLWQRSRRIPGTARKYFEIR